MTKLTVDEELSKELGAVRNAVIEALKADDKAYIVAEVNAELIDCDTDTYFTIMADYAIMRTMWEKLPFTGKLQTTLTAMDLAVKNAEAEWNEVHNAE